MARAHGVLLCGYFLLLADNKFLTDTPLPMALHLLLLIVITTTSITDAQHAIPIDSIAYLQ